MTTNEVMFMAYAELGITNIQSINESENGIRLTTDIGENQTVTYLFLVDGSIAIL